MTFVVSPVGLWRLTVGTSRRHIASQILNRVVTKSTTSYSGSAIVVKNLCIPSPDCRHLLTVQPTDARLYCVFPGHFSSFFWVNATSCPRTIFELSLIGLMLLFLWQSNEPTIHCFAPSLPRLLARSFAPSCSLAYCLAH